MNPVEPFDRNVYILGAGFSAAAGAPLLNTFLDVSLRLWEDPEAPLDDAQRSDFGKVFQFRREMSQAREKVRIDLDNVEHLFGLIDIAERLSPDGVETRQAILTLIARTLELTTNKDSLPVIGFRPQNVVPPHIAHLPQAYARGQHSTPPEFRADIYSHFAGIVSGLLDPPDKRRKRQDTVITFNYDLILDRALRKVGMGVDYRLPNAKSSSAGPAVALIKLHGSINWAICRKCGNVQMTDTDESWTTTRSCSKCQQVAVPLLIPPSWNKASSNSFSTDALFSLWNAAAEALRTATRICVIGYSIPETDAFFRYLLTIALARNHHLSTFLLVDPAPTVNAKLQELLEPIFLERRYKHFPCSFAEALSNTNFYNSLRRGHEVSPNFSSYGPMPRNNLF